MLATFIDKLLTEDGELLRYFATMLLPLLAVKLLPLPVHLQPLLWLGELANALTAKVLHTNRAANQQALAGILALLLLVLPFWVISSLLLYLAVYPWFFEMLILYFCLQDLRFIRIASEISHTLQAQDKALARRRLSSWVIRDTQELSETGIAKTTIELLVTLPAYRLLANLLAYVLLGAPACLLLAMLWQLQQCWWSQAPKYRYFSQALSWANQLLFWLPLWLWRLSLAINGGFPWLFKRFVIVQYPELTGYQQLCALSAAMLHIELGGPQKYAGNKINSNRYCFGNLPSAPDIDRALSLVKAAMAFWLILLSAIPVIWIALRWFYAH
ncbi:cobalamin biosynthesis protein [Shewanella dokdonensis]|uniref:cobalamin biosynthesis protein n=1 Tax=Shewanella dokdonensis TaxID=712036 RepID=UPI00200EC2B1|nr:cobalamin biosynthesis protein [Shewanella dokdonensis]MCL1073668.1 cobalamin biosynthesis protein [Shewanella dokdonensis]